MHKMPVKDSVLVCHRERSSTEENGPGFAPFEHGDYAFSPDQVPFLFDRAQRRERGTSQRINLAPVRHVQNSARIR